MRHVGDMTGEMDRKGDRMKALALIVLAAVMGVGCFQSSPIWQMRNVPTTEVEREKVSQETEKILAATPKSLAGHDQDWDDAIAEANRVACETWCKPTLWERAPIGSSGLWDYTGNWKKTE